MHPDALAVVIDIDALLDECEGPSRYAGQSVAEVAWAVTDANIATANATSRTDFRFTASLPGSTRYELIVRCDVVECDVVASATCPVAKQHAVRLGRAPRAGATERADFDAVQPDVHLT